MDFLFIFIFVLASYSRTSVMVVNQPIRSSRHETPRNPDHLETRIKVFRKLDLTESISTKPPPVLEAQLVISTSFHLMEATQDSSHFGQRIEKRQQKGNQFEEYRSYTPPFCLVNHKYYLPNKFHNDF